VSSPALEAFLARLYADEATLAAFLDNPGPLLAASGLAEAEIAAVRAIDRVGLVMAARSYRAKRAGRRKAGA
jgi:hypothetical protein